MLLPILIAMLAPLPDGAMSWSKPGVDFDTYRAEAVYCGRQGANMEVSNTPEAAILVNASRQIETINETGVPNSGNNVRDLIPVGGVAMDMTLDQTYNPEIARSIEQSHRIGRVVQGARLDVQLKRTGARLQSAIDTCLANHGYRRFRLTDEQQRHLRKLRRGSPERHAYLFSLASDPRVLEQQGID